MTYNTNIQIIFYLLVNVILFITYSIKTLSDDIVSAGTTFEKKHA